MNSTVSPISTTPLFGNIGATLENAFTSAKELCQLMNANEEMSIASSRIVAYLPSNVKIEGEDDHTKLICLVNSRITELIDQIKNQPNAEKLLEIGKCYYILGDFPNAYASYLSAFRYNQQVFTSEDWYLFGALHQHFTGYHEALDCFLKVNTKEFSDAKNKDFTMRFAILNRQLKNYDLAFKLFSSLANNPPEKLTVEDITLQIAFTSYQSLKTDDSLKMVNNLLAVYPKNELLIRESLILQFLISNTIGLNELLPTILNYYRNYPDYYISLLLARIYYLLGQYVESYEYFKVCMDYWGENATFWVAIGLLYYQNEQLDEAAIAFQRSIYMKQNGRVAWLNLGFIFEKKNDKENAIRIYNTGLKQCNHPEFSNRISRIGQGQLLEIDDNTLFEQVPETVEKQYLRAIPLINLSFLNQKKDQVYFDQSYDLISAFGQQ
ncbi:TPR Domain containing protein [Trichomonas vaginalis G3]|uniref:TPR Domain containing protein n=1 Tax=Trichomonas vaginalis (strain ATCC PRA-98 / G3) TaxID=412133 RepID=A2EN60_TRIV3|nr:cellular component assembly [Trichomonas vaginalis G3]EAY05897.1 TPR Domain containing protein [Trichomonas vaginalis G3]KAI5520219.1 cellular component assembly [Trichomonas vaginalis G3]|eukprot:XP_001318120.1 TPR Domain containing protein [Trichomonas vaginalis G3]